MAEPEKPAVKIVNPPPIRESDLNKSHKPAPPKTVPNVPPPPPPPGPDQKN